LFPGLQTADGIVSAACLVRLRRSRRLARLEHYSSTLSRRTVEHVYVEHFPCLQDSARDGNIVGAGGWVAAGVVVGDNDGRGVLAHCLAEDFPDPDLGRTNRAAIQLDHFDDPVAPVEQHDAQVFLFEGLHVVLQQFSGVAGGVDGRAFFGRFNTQSAPQFDGCFDLGGFGFSQAMLAHQFVEGRAVDSGDPAHGLQQALADLYGVLARHTDSQQDGYQFSIGERLRPAIAQPLTRTLVIVQVGNAV
jgi:hypothetical protein